MATKSISPLQWIGWATIFTGVITVSAGLGATLAFLAPFQISNQPAADTATIGNFLKGGFQYGISRPVNILIMGIDKAEAYADGTEPEDVFQSRSDTMLLARLNPETGKVNLLTIPRDTQVEVSGLGRTKINHANWRGGPELAVSVVSDTLNGVSIDRYIRVSTGAFRELVDLVGGVEVHVPTRMEYEDVTQGLKIDLEPGLQTLNGEQAEGFVRYRSNHLGDIGRGQRQQMLLKALQKRFQNPLMLARLPQIFTVLQKHIDSNLSLGEMLALLQFGVQTSGDDLQMVLLPGRFSDPEEFELSYWIMDLAGMDQIMQNYFDVNPPYDGSADYTGRDNFGVKIVVQNASDDPDADTYMYDYLQDLGFYNIAFEDRWPEELRDTEIVPQWGDLEAAQQLQSMLLKSKVAADSTGSLRSDITIRVGNRWARQYRESLGTEGNGNESSSESWSNERF